MKFPRSATRRGSRSGCRKGKASVRLLFESMQGNGSHLVQNLSTGVVERGPDACCPRHLALLGAERSTARHLIGVQKGGRAFQWRERGYLSACEGSPLLRRQRPREAKPGCPSRTPHPARCLSISGSAPPSRRVQRPASESRSAALHERDGLSLRSPLAAWCSQRAGRGVGSEESRHAPRDATSPIQGSVKEDRQLGLRGASSSRRATVQSAQPLQGHLLGSSLRPVATPPHGRRGCPPPSPSSSTPGHGKPCSASER